jgi:sugar transferase (PEP-CTERM system associated)
MTRPYRIFRHYVQSKSLLLFLGDALLLTGSLFLDEALRAMNLFAPWSDAPHGIPTITVFVLLGIMSFYLAGLYESNPLQSGKEMLVRTVTAGIVWGILYLTLGLSVREDNLAWWGGVPAVIIGTLAVILLRGVFAFLVRTEPFRERVLFLGATPTAERLVRELETNHPGYQILGYVDDRPADQLALTNGFRVLGATPQLKDIAAATGVGTIVVCLTERRGTFPLQPILECKLRGIRIEDWPTFYEKLTGKIVVQNLRTSWLVFSEGFNRTLVTRTMKRWIDLVLAGLLLALAGPILLLVAVAIRLNSSGPVFFRQERVGEGGQTFTLLKFRTMVDNAEAESGPVWANDHDPRATAVGCWLRKTRIDEIPQIWNVLKGEMSFIGPRPERPHFVARLQQKIPYYAERHSIKPGITGWAQVRYRYGASIEEAEEKLQYDLYYVKNMSHFLDALILLSSIQVVLFGKGAR